MNRNPDLKLPWLPLLALGCFACSTFVGAQQTSGMPPASSAPAAGPTRSGLYPTDSSGPDRDSMRGFASPMGSKASAHLASTNSRSTWMAGANSTDSTGAVMWNAPQADFPGAIAPSWNAGARSFGLDRQQVGIWLEMQIVGIQPDILTYVDSNKLFAPSEANSNVESSDLFAPSDPASNVESRNSFIPRGLTPKGVALIKGAALSAPYAPLSGTGFGSRGMANPFAAQHGVGSVKSQFGSRTTRFGSLGNGSESKPATLVTPSTGTQSGPANDDTLHLDDGIGSGKALGSDELDGTEGTSH